MKTGDIKWTLLLCILINLNKIAESEVILDLGGVWEVTNSKNITIPANVPGGIYTDLMSSGIIEDVFWGLNDLNYRWVAKDDWTYSGTFSVSRDIMENQVVNLVFNGIDTFATVFVNGIELGTTDNMFVQYIYEVKSQLVLGENNITVQIRSPIVVANETYHEQAADYIVYPECVPPEYQGECHVNHIRKMQASFAWDWGPAFPSMGIWKQVFLEGFNSTVVRDIVINLMDTSEEKWTLEITTYFAPNPQVITLNGMSAISLQTDAGMTISRHNVNATEDENGDFKDVHSFTVLKSVVQTWWPNGYGESEVYDLEVLYFGDGDETTKKNIRIGFRTVELVQDPIESGREFYFRVNGIPIFAKGSNIIPLSVLPELGQNNETIRFLLQSAKDVNMNMLRVWGGGIYESDDFYDVADEMGIMIWQDFMFACSMYPTTNKFLSSVQDEVRHQVRRLQHHASIVLWAGNNENEAALRQNWYGTDENFNLYKNDYVKLYIDNVKSTLMLNDKMRQFLTSSPTNGIQSDNDGYIAQNPGSHFFGDVHFYDYVLDPWNADKYPITRFASEYGYQSLPSMDTLMTATNISEDLWINSTFLSKRQHHPFGYEEMKNLILARLNLPEESSPNYNKAFVFYSQIIQAMAYKIESEYYRQWRDTLNDVGKGFTMGALYWQLNDVWVAPTWAGIDFQMKWKMAHYFAKNFFAPIIVTGHLKADRQLDIYVISDSIFPNINATVDISVYKWNSFDRVRNNTIVVDEIGNGTAQLVSSFFIDQYLADSTCGTVINAKNACFIHLTVNDNQHETLGPDNFVFPSDLKSGIPVPILRVTGVDQVDTDGREFEVEVSTDAISLFVWLDTKEIRGQFSENGFLQITETKIVTFYAADTTTARDLENALTVTHLKDAQYT